MLNKLEKLYCNYQPKFTGKGLRIADLAFNSSPFPNVFDGLAHIPIQLMETSPFDSMPGKYSHSYATVSIIKDMLPDAEIFLLPQNNDGIKWAIANGIHIVNASLWNVNADDDLEQKLGQNALLTVGAGNTTNSPDEGPTAKLSIWTSSSAVELKDQTIHYPWYCSSGAGAIDLVGFSNLEVNNMEDRQPGTSFSNPFNVGLIGQYYDAYNQKFGHFPKPDQARDFIFKIAKPVVGDRIKEGYGLPILPNFDTYDFGIQLIIGNNNINHSGVNVRFDTPPQIINSRTMIPVSMLREIGVKVYWDEKNKRVNVER